MNRRSIRCTLVAGVLLMSAACTRQGVPFVAGDRGFAMAFPPGWAANTSDGALEELEEQRRSALAASGGGASAGAGSSRVLMVLEHHESATGMVVRTMLPDEPSRRSLEREMWRTMSAEGPAVDAMLAIVEAEGGGQVRRTWTRTVAGKSTRCVVVGEPPALGKRAQLKCSLLLDDSFVDVVIQGEGDEIDELAPELDALLAGISTESDAVGAAEQEREERRAGLFTGLWHGALLLPRLLLDLFFDVDLMADVNTGSTYTIAFWAMALLVLGAFRN